MAAGVLWSTRGRKAWLVILPFLTVGLAWSSVDPMECSAWWRGRVFYEKLAGHLPYIPWMEVRHKALSGCSSFYESERDVKQKITLLETKTSGGHKLERYRTPLGDFWILAPGQTLLAWLVWEQTLQHDYESEGVRIRPGDVVIDGGAHVGTFTRYALDHGAARVVAIEPEPTNIACLEMNLAADLAAGRVVLVKAGIWDVKTTLTLSDSHDNSAGHSFVRTVPDSEALPGMPLVTLDEIAAELQLDRVDFIKMDIEGAERRALAGAKQTLARFKPRMAISSYHMRDDPEAIPAVVRSVQTGYKISGKDYEDGPRRLITKVLFFE
jgi:FkbM family methyltransferase